MRLLAAELVFAALALVVVGRDGTSARPAPPLLTVQVLVERCPTAPCQEIPLASRLVFDRLGTTSSGALLREGSTPGTFSGAVPPGTYLLTAVVHGRTVDARVVTVTGASPQVVRVVLDGADLRAQAGR